MLRLQASTALMILAATCLFTLGVDSMPQNMTEDIIAILQWQNTLPDHEVQGDFGDLNDHSAI